MGKQRKPRQRVPDHDPHHTGPHVPFTWDDTPEEEPVGPEVQKRNDNEKILAGLGLNTVLDPLRKKRKDTQAEILGG